MSKMASTPTKILIRGIALACVLAGAHGAARAQLGSGDLSLIGANVQKRANGVLALMGFLLTPDVTTGSLSISNDPTSNPDFSQTSLGGGFTISRDLPLYLEGTAGYSRYDPTFVASGGGSERPIPVKWNSLTLTGGVGWDFPLTTELKLRPIFNFSLGRVDALGIGTVIPPSGDSARILVLQNRRSGLASFGLLVHHDDAAREFAYDRDSSFGRLARGLDEGPKRGWTIVSMKNDWKAVYPAP